MEQMINKSAKKSLQLSRRLDRPNADDYIAYIVNDFLEFHGDRLFGDDPSIIGGIGRIGERTVTVIGQAKGKTLEENIHRNFGMNRPEGYRKSLRLMKQAEKFSRPIICFVDTPGAFCGIEAEERGQGEAIAHNIIEMISLKTPIISVVIGEGGSGGALALSVADRIFMLENSIYSVISPEGFSSILWKDKTRVDEAAELLKIRAEDLLYFGVIDDLIQEPGEGAHESRDIVLENTRQLLEATLNQLEDENMENLIRERQEKYRKIGSQYPKDKNDYV